MGAVLGFNRYRTPHDVWLEKTGRAEPFEGNLQTRFGTYAEEFVAREYCRQTGATVRRHTGTLRSPHAPLIGHVDRLVVPPGAKVAAIRGKVLAERGLECKTAHALAATRPEEWGASDTDFVPPSYLIQCAVYMHLTGCNRWDLAVLFGNSAFHIFSIVRDMELEAAIVAKAAEWWQAHVVADVPPEPRTEAEARARWPRHQPGKVATLDEAQAAELATYRRLKAEADAATEAAQAIRDRLMPVIADADEIHDPAGRVLATYRANKDGKKTDWQAVAQAAGASPETIDAHTLTTPGARVLRLSKEI
jgi:predicted phage-related endonuclease